MSKRSAKKVQDQCQEIIYSALDIIKKSAFTDKNGTRWEGVCNDTIKKPKYPNVYFTSAAVRAIVLLQTETEFFTI